MDYNSFVEGYVAGICASREKRNGDYGLPGVDTLKKWADNEYHEMLYGILDPEEGLQPPTGEPEEEKKDT